MTTESCSERTLLVVEDDQDIRESLCDALDAEGYQSVAAANGREALDRLGEMSRPCLILLDLMMPVMTGGEFLEILRNTESTARLPVVVVSAWPQEARQVQHQTQGFLSKPVALRMLLETIGRFCQRPARGAAGEARLS